MQNKLVALIVLVLSAPCWAGLSVAHAEPISAAPRLVIQPGLDFCSLCRCCIETSDGALHVPVSPDSSNIFALESAPNYSALVPLPDLKLKSSPPGNNFGLAKLRATTTTDFCSICNCCVTVGGSLAIDATKFMKTEAVKQYRFLVPSR